MKRRIAALLVAAASLATAGGQLVGARPVFAGLDVAAAESQFLDLLNADRASAGLQALQADPRLMDVARWRSEDMVSRNFFGHDLGGYTIGSILRDRQIPFKLAGENIVSNTFDDVNTVALAQVELMKSASHRDNVLRADYNLVGVGIAVSSTGKIVYTQIFVQSVPAITTPAATLAAAQGAPGTAATPAATPAATSSGAPVAPAGAATPAAGAGGAAQPQVAGATGGATAPPPAPVASATAAATTGPAPATGG